MKKKFFMALIALSAGVFYTTRIQAQDTTSVGEDLKNAGKKTGKAIGKAGKAVGKGAKKVGTKTAEVAVKSHSAIVDKTYDGKEGPRGEKIYIDGHSKYYYIDKKGHKKYLILSELKDKKS